MGADAGLNLKPQPRASLNFSSPELLRVLDDLKRFTLDHLPNDLARLVCLASMRDYNTGDYHHDGLTSQYAVGLAGAAIDISHREIFEQVVLLALENFVDELDRYFEAMGQARSEARRFWEENEPYRVLIPKDTDAIARTLFISNTKVALVVLGARVAEASPHARQFA